MKKDYDEMVSKIIVEKFGEELESKAGFYKLLFKFAEYLFYSNHL